MFKMVRKAKSEAYRKTAEMVTSSGIPGILPMSIAWAFALVVALVGPGIWATGVFLILCVPASVVAYCIGRRRS